MKKYSILFLIICISTVCNAQKGIYLGVVSGINTSFVLDKGLKQDPRYIEKLTLKTAPIEFVSNLNFKETFGLKASVGLTNAGQIYDIINTAKQVVGKREIDLKYLAFGLMIQRLWGNDKVNSGIGVGPQLLLMQQGKEVAQWAAGTFQIPNELLPSNVLPNATGVYQLLDQPEKILASLENSDPVKRFAETQLAISGGFSINFKIVKHVYFNTNIKIDYNFTDTRGKDLINGIKSGNVKDLLGHRSNILVGAVGGLIFKL